MKKKQPHHKPIPTHDLNEDTTPIWDDGEDLMPNIQSAATEDKPSFDKIVDRVGGPILVASVIGFGAWLINIDRTTQKLLYEQEAQTKQQSEISTDVKAMRELISTQLPDVNSRVTFIEKTRYTQERGQAVESKVQSLESDVEEIKKSKRK